MLKTCNIKSCKFSNLETLYIAKRKQNLKGGGHGYYFLIQKKCLENFKAVKIHPIFKCLATPTNPSTTRTDTPV